MLILVLALVTEGTKADYTFGKAQNLGPVVNSSANEAGITLSSDGLELYFGSQRSGGLGDYDIWYSSRRNVNEAWDPPVNLGPTVNSRYTELYPCLSSDGLTLYFSDYYSGSPRSGGRGGGDIWISTRISRDDPWTPPVNLGDPVNSANLDMSPTVSADGLTLVFTSRNRAGGFGSWDVWMSTRAVVQDSWGPPVNLGQAVNSGNWEGESGLSADGRALVFGTGRPGIVGSIDLWMSTRKSLADPWDVAVSLGPEVNSSADDGTGRFSPDMRTLYFCSDRPGGLGGYDLFEAPIVPVVDLNGDGIVDAGDMCIVVDHWGTDNQLCDIGPAPWGDGIVDVQDLIVIAEHLFEEIYPPELVDYWKLDEAEGDIAFNSTSNNHGLLSGSPIWQPEMGKIDGAIELDGIDDYIDASFVLNPADGPFSVLVWIRGEAPGQVIIAQTDGAGTGETWLGTDASAGNLMTGLVPPAAGRFVPQPLISESIITDGLWHHIAFVWDGGYRILYVDGTEVARDAAVQNPLKSADGGLIIGAGKNLDAGTYFSGLIDDVRIYNAALTTEQIGVMAQ